MKSESGRSGEEERGMPRIYLATVILQHASALTKGKAEPRKRSRSVYLLAFQLNSGNNSKYTCTQILEQ